MTDAELAERLTAFAPALVDGMSRCSGVRRLSGGASQETYLVSLEGDGATCALILRRRPDGAVGDERTVALATEAALIKAVARQGAPTPDVLRVFTPADGLGEAYAMRRIEGETLGRRIVRDDAFKAVRPGLARRCGAVLAAIHRTPLAEVPPLRVSDAHEELNRYEDIYRGSGARRPVLETAFRRLRRRAPPPTAPALLHGDFRNGNLMIHPVDGLAAVLDWELAHIGSPASDLGWLCVNSWRFGAFERPVGGFGDYEDLLAGYADAGGRAITLEEVLYWQALGSLKWGVMCLIMYMSFASGADRSVERAMIGRRVSETEIDLITLFDGALR